MANKVKNAYKDGYYWLEDDERPSGNISLGAEGLEVDTKKVFVWDGTAWIEYFDLS